MSRTTTASTPAPSESSPEPVESAAPPTRFLGRQPILDIKKDLYGYELLFRAGTANAFSGDRDDAILQVTDNWLMLLPEAGQGHAFFNCTRKSLISGIVTLLPAASTVLEILETVEPDDEIIECCLALKASGYRFALDDFTPLAENLPFIPLADFIKIDFLASDVQTRREIYAMAAGSGAKMLAEKIETEAEFQIARDEGCEYFQGYFFSRPIIVSPRNIPQNQIAYVRLLGALNQPSVDMHEIEKLIMSDASLCFRLLRLVNSAAYHFSATIDSIRTALLLVGHNQVRKLVTVAMAGTFASSSSKTLVVMALVRGRFCELLAPALNEEPSKLYLLGMLSLVDVILRMPMSQLMTSLPIDAQMKSALLGKDSSVSVALDLVRCCEAGDWTRIEHILNHLGLPENTCSLVYAQAVQWADSIIAQ